ncbi:MAG: PhoX family protein [Actinomycetota bacterium]|nr:PhoX family protein [Actinomycetota bacterium]
MTGLDRRSFLKAGSATLLATTGLQAISMRMAEAAPGNRRGRGRPRTPHADYGPLSPQVAVNTRDRWLALPAGFSYSVIGKTGSVMSDGRRSPRSHDGMGAFTSASGAVTLIRNQEIRFNSGPQFSQGEFVIEASAGSYDPTAGGGTTTLRFDPRQFRTASGGLTQHFVSLTGTVVNCAGGIAPGGDGWLTCEEIVQDEAAPGTVPGSVPRTDQRHGYVFHTPLRGVAPGRPASSRPLVAMGRFAHEAAAVDDRTGTVYLTEDAGSGRGSGFYRFLPTDPADLAKGGVLQILGVTGRPGSDLREGQLAGRPMPVTWITIEQPDPAGEAPNAVFEEGFANGAAKFNRLEGCWDGSGSIFFASTSGGDAKNGDVNPDGFEEGYGQIWEYVPGGGGGQLVLLYESPDGDVLDSPDNIVVSPRGGLVICEDDSSAANANQSDVSEFFGEDKNRLIGLTLQGTPFPIAENIVNDSELAGACWSADGRFLFVNVFGYDEEDSGGTCAITGPWARGAL